MTKLTTGRNLRVLVSPHIKETGSEAISGLGAGLGVEVTLIAAAPDLTEQTLAGIDAAFFSRDIHSMPGSPPSNGATRLFFRQLDACTGLQWLHIFSAGSDRPKFKELQARGVSVTTSPDASGHAVGTSALAGILALNKHLPWHYANQSGRTWRAVPDERCPLPLDRQTAVLIGTGHIGAALAKYLQALALRTIGINRSGKAVPGFDETLPQSALDSVIGRADWLIICCPLTEETRNLVSADRLAALPQTAHLINVGRGGIVDELALLQALRGKRIAGAYLDVFEREPLPPESGFWELDNAIITPHSAARIADFNERAFACFLDNLERWLSQQALRNIAS